MKHITMRNEQSEYKVLELDTLYACFEEIPDPRDARGKRYPLAFLLMSIFLAKLAGENKPAGITEWIRLRRAALVEMFACRWALAPSLNMIRRTLADASVVAALEQVGRRFLQQSYGGQQTALVVLDGKTMRGTIPPGASQGVHLVSAYLPAEGITLAQEVVANKENEIVAAPRLLQRLDLRQRVVCGDALFTQRDLSVQVLRQGGDYLWFAKENQPRLAADIQHFFQPPRVRPGWPTRPLPSHVHQTVNKGHGRLEKRTLKAIADDGPFLDWPGVAQVFELCRQTTCLRTGERAVQVVYGLTSLTPTAASPARLQQLLRDYWGIENGLHYRRDTTFQEDATRFTNRHQAQGMAVLHNFTIGLLSKLGFANLASARRCCDAALMRAFAATNYL